MDQTEAELIAAVLGGDSASFEPLIEKYSPRVSAHCPPLRQAGERGRGHRSRGLAGKIPEAEKLSWRSAFRTLAHAAGREDLL